MRYLTTIPLKLKTSSGEVELKPGDSFRPDNPEAIKTLLRESKVKPLSEVMGEKYRELTGWLHQFDLTGDEIKEVIPGLYLDIQDAIERLDESFVNEDMPTFQDALDKVRLLYTEAMLKCGRRIAVKVYSEVLQAYLWVIETDEDMHSQRSQGNAEAIYTRKEIAELKKLPKEDLKEIHKVKEVFPMSTIEEITNKVNFVN